MVTIINVIASRLQVDHTEVVNHKQGETKGVALHFDETELKIAYEGSRLIKQNLKWKFSKVKLIPSETRSGFGYDTLQADGLTLNYTISRQDKRAEIQRLLKAPIPSASSSSSSSSGKTKENVNRQTPSTGSTGNSEHQQRKANMTAKSRAVQQSQQPISVAKSASVSRDSFSSSSSGNGASSHEWLTSPLVDRQQQARDASDLERAIAGDPPLPTAYISNLTALITLSVG